MSLKITTLIENMPDEEGKLVFEHGFSALIEVDGKKILFDTGQTGAFIKNAEDLQVDLAALDMVVLSHGHYDHTGGVPKLLDCLKKRTPFYIGKEFFEPKYKCLEDGSYKYNGNPFEKELIAGRESKAELRVVEDDVTWISEHVVLIKNFVRVTEYEVINPKFFVKDGTGYRQDLFPDEIALGVVTEAGLVVVAGCSHVGIINIIEQIRRVVKLPVAAIVGGTHLVEAQEHRLIKTAEGFKASGIKKIAVSHCTGEAGMNFLSKEFGDGFMKNNTGRIIEF